MKLEYNYIVFDREGNHTFIKYLPDMGGWEWAYVIPLDEWYNVSKRKGMWTTVTVGIPPALKAKVLLLI